MLGLGVFATVAYDRVPARSPETKPVEIPPLLVRVITVEPETLSLKVRAEGTVAPRTESQLVPEVAGRVVEVSPSLAAGGFFRGRRGAAQDRGPRIRLGGHPRQCRHRAGEIALGDRAARSRSGAPRSGGLWVKGNRIRWSCASRRSPKPWLRSPRPKQPWNRRSSTSSGRSSARRTPAAFARSRLTSVNSCSAAPPVATLYSVDLAEVKLPIPDAELEFVNLPLAYRGAAESARAEPAVTLTCALRRARAQNGAAASCAPKAKSTRRRAWCMPFAQVEDPYAPGRDARRPPLAVGMFVEAEIDGRRVSNIVRLPRTALRGDSRVLVVDSTNRLYYREVDIFPPRPRPGRWCAADSNPAIASVSRISKPPSTG